MHTVIDKALQLYTPVREQPFPHIVIEDCLPKAYYDELCNTFPEELVCATNPVDFGITYRYKANPALLERKIPDIWLEFFENHTSGKYLQNCIDLFMPYLQKHNKELTSYIVGAPSGVRNVSDHGKPLVTDCQFVVHDPIPETQSTRPAHLDNGVEIYAGLLYMKKPEDESVGGNLTLHKLFNPLTELAKDRIIPNELHAPIVQVPYKENTFAMFLNVPDSVHSVTPRVNAKEARRSINIIGEFHPQSNKRMWTI